MGRPIGTSPPGGLGGLGLYVVVGPTAVGKTRYAIELAERLGSPVINADSRQIYRGLEIGTAAPTREEMARVRHYFVATHDVGQYYSAAQYESDALQLIARLFDEGHKALVMSGGSMMYIDAVCRGIDPLPTITPQLRETLARRLASEGLEPLLQELRERDPAYAAIVDPKNTRRVVHALEICLQTGGTYTALRSGTSRQRPFRIVKIGLNRPRPELFDRINRRVENMIAEGLEQEARRWYPLRHENALNTVGYKEMFAYIEGRMTLPEAILRIQKNTRVYAKKQLTWWAKDPTIQWITP